MATSGKSAGFRIQLALAIIGSTAVAVAPLAYSILLQKDSPVNGGSHRLLIDNHNGDDRQEEVSEESSFMFRPLFPLRSQDYVGFAAATLGLILAAGGGVGGGGFLVPTFILIMGFPVKHAVSLSNVTVLGGSTANMLLNFPKRRPSPADNRPLIDWNLIAMMEPLTMAGALIGADLNEYLPDVVLVTLLVVLLGFLSFRTLQKANKLHDLESKNGDDSTTTADAKEDEEALLRPVVEVQGPSSSSINLSYGTQCDSSRENDMETNSVSKKELDRLLEKESQVPWVRIVELLGLFLAVTGLNLLKGSGDKLEWIFHFDVTCGSPAFYWLAIFNLVVIVGFALYIRLQLIQDTARKQALQYKFAPGDILWDGRNTLVYSSICSLAGVFAGMFGIGGGIVKSPLMLEMGVHPAVASATSAAMILFTSFTATTSYLVYGELNYHYAVVCVVLGFFSTVVGQLLMDGLLAKYNRHSHITYSVALVVGISTVAMTLESVLAIAQGQSKQGAGMCPSVP